MGKQKPTPYLKLLGPEKTQEQVFEVSADEVLIGRSSDADFVVLIDRSVSRQHAK
ncbi:MAG: FHA domain-containing protein, partial [Acidobacteriota bacterium]